MSARQGRDHTNRRARPRSRAQTHPVAPRPGGPRSPVWYRDGLWGLLAAVSVVLASCQGSTTTTAGCQEVREAEDPRSGLHVVQVGSVTYLTDPPTSGPHSSGPTPAGPLSAPLALEIQVRLLEAGGSVITYPSQLAPGQIAQLAALTSERVVSAPSANPRDEIVVTAWTWKLTCSPAALDTAQIRAFLEQRTTDAPGLD